MTRLNEFSWIDDSGALHVDLEALVKHLGKPYDEQNRRLAFEYATEFFQREYPETQIIVDESSKD